MLLTIPSSWSGGVRPGRGAALLSRCHHREARARRRASSQAIPSTQQVVASSLTSLDDSIVVVGGGPAGLATAVALQAVGLPAVVLERQGELSTSGTALGLWTNAWRALDALQAAEPLREQHLLVAEVELCRSNGRRLRSFSLGECEGGPHEFRGVRRSQLLQALADRLAPGTLHLGSPVEAVRATATGASIQLGGGDRQSVHCLAVVGAEGRGSAAGAALGRRAPRYVGQTAIRGIAVYPGGVPCNSIRQIWGRGPRAGMYPISDTELYWFVVFDVRADAPIPPTAEDVRQEALQTVAGWEWGAADVIQRTPEESLVRSRVSDRWDVPLGSRTGAVTLAGDALHPMTPNLGQGGCTALEDAVVLGRLLKEKGLPALLEQPLAGGRRGAALQLISQAFQDYERERARRCLPITVRSFAMGALLQLPLPPVVAARDFFVERLFSPSHFLDHAAYDCQELELLASRLPEYHKIVGVDLSEGMIELAHQRIDKLGLRGRVEAQVGDAASLDFQGLAGVVSVFGLQQIPEPQAVLANWTRALGPRGVMAVCYWGKDVENEGPWKQLMDLTVNTRPQEDWEAGIPGEVLKQVSVAGQRGAVQQGAEVVQDCRPAHTMSWPSVEEFWEHGEEHMAQLKREFMKTYPDPSVPLSHKPYARLLVLRRLAAAL
ncbi:hypothetical protein N2152v2_006939 [Parachlorella kessleri]